MNRNLFLLSLAGMLSFGLITKAAGTPNRDDKDKIVKIKTSAICEMCKERIERNLSFEKGVKEANLNVETKVVTVIYNPGKTDIAKLKANISKTGYDADELTADEKGYNKLPGCCKKTASAMDH
jgi:periplasmic mercuric ion binding protein